MSELAKLNFPAIRLRARRRGKQVEVWDELRGIWLVLTPEEWVRRHLIAYLTTHCGVHPMRIAQEYAVSLNGQDLRADVVVVDDTAAPLLLVECKASHVGISQEAFAQAVRYNSILEARYIILTDGIHHYCHELCNGEYIPLTDFPNLNNSPSAKPTEE